MTYPGRLISFEGIDRAGKTTAVNWLKSNLSSNKAINVCGEFYSPIGPIIKDLLLKEVPAFSKTFLFSADRAITYENVGLPALKRGEVVLWDRYVDSAIAYRMVDFSRNKPENIDIEFVWEINKPFVEPDLIIYIDISVKTSLERSRISGSKEPYKPSFLDEVRSSYLSLAKKRNYLIINGEHEKDVVRLQIKKIIEEHLLLWKI